MKVAIFAVLIFCVAATQADIRDYSIDLYELEESSDIIPVPRAEILEKLKNAANQFVRNSINEFHKVEEKFKKITENIYNKAEAVGHNIEEKVKDSVAKVEDKVKDFINKGKIFLNCVKQNFPDFKDFGKVTLENLEECGKNLLHSIGDFEKAASGHATDLVAALAKLSAIIVECVSNNAASSAKCAISEIDNAKKIVTSIITDFEYLVQVVREKAGPILNDIHVCKQNNFSSIVEKAKEVGEKMRQCTRNN